MLTADEKQKKIHGTRNDYHLVEQDDYLLVDGLHEPIVSEEPRNDAQVVQLSQRKPDTHINIDLDLDELDITAVESKATYDEIKEALNHLGMI